MKWATRRAQAVMAVSTASVAYLRGTFGVEDGQLVVLRNGVDTDRFRPGTTIDRQRTRAAMGLPANATVVTCTANLLPVKAIDVLLAAWRHVSMAQRNVHLVIAGDGPTRPDLEALAVDLGISDTVHLVGRRNDTSDLLRASDLFVLASHYEGTSNALLEAMASGLPIVASAVGGNPELIAHHRTGWLVPPAHPHRLARTILAALLDRAARERVGSAARVEAIRSFTQEAWATAYTRLCRRLAAATHGCELTAAEGMACAG